MTRSEARPAVVELILLELKNSYYLFISYIYVLLSHLEKEVIYIFKESWKPSFNLCAPLINCKHDNSFTLPDLARCHRLHNN